MPWIALTPADLKRLFNSEDRGHLPCNANQARKDVAVKWPANGA